MSRLIKIRERIKSVKSIYQVTKAMDLVTKTKINSIRQNANMSKDYFEYFQQLFSLVSAIKQGSSDIIQADHQEALHKYGVVFLSQKGFCGNFNDKVLGKLLIRLTPFDLAKNIELFLVGKKSNKWAHTIKRPYQHVPAPEKSCKKDLRPLVKKWCRDILQNKNIEIYLIYNEFFSVLQQVPTVKKIYPFPEVSISAAENIILEPGVDSIFEQLLPAYFEATLEQVYWESLAGEYCARLINMQNANKNAKMMIDNLHLLYNKTRQLKITQELSEIVSAFDVLKQHLAKKEQLAEISL